MGLDTLIDGSETDHWETHDALALLANGMAKNPALTPAAMTFYAHADFPKLADTGDGNTLIKETDLGTGTAGSTKLLSKRKWVNASIQYRDFVVDGSMVAKNGTKRFLWEEAAKLIAIRFRLDTVTNGNLILEYRKSGSNLLAAQAVIGSGVQTLRVSSWASGGADVIAGDEHQICIISPVPSNPGVNLSAAVAFRPVLA